MVIPTSPGTLGSTVPPTKLPPTLGIKRKPAPAEIGKRVSGPRPGVAGVKEKVSTFSAIKTGVGMASFEQTVVAVPFVVLQDRHIDFPLKNITSMNVLLWRRTIIILIH